MHIVLTNDDGIDAPGLQVLEHVARSLPQTRKVTVVAPAHEQSGVGHAITYKRALRYDRIDDDHFSVNGTPADCVLVALGQICTSPPDLILSGVNNGNNAAQNTLYSGTVGATIEAAFQGVKAIALSQFYGPDMDKDNPFDAAYHHAGAAIAQIIADDLWMLDDWPVHYNVNFPPIPAAHVQGLRYTSQGVRAGRPFFATAEGDAVWLRGAPQAAAAPDGTDLGANMAGYIAITPCGVDLTQHGALAALRTGE